MMSIYLKQGLSKKPFQGNIYITNQRACFKISMMPGALDMDLPYGISSGFVFMRKQFAAFSKLTTISGSRILQMSVAHDLRNPIAIVEGYVEYMQQCLADGNLGDEELRHTLQNLAITAKRFEHYTDTIRDLNAIEETETKYSVVRLPDFLRSAAEGLSLLAKQHGLELAFHSDISECQVKLDEQIFYRIVENIFSNVIRYARSKVIFEYALADGMLTISISDDGRGFSRAMLGKKNTLLYSEDKTGEHMGLGLATSRVLSQKHGGSLELSNEASGGGCVTIKLAVYKVG